MAPIRVLTAADAAAYRRYLAQLHVEQRRAERARLDKVTSGRELLNLQNSVDEVSKT